MLCSSTSASVGPLGSCTFLGDLTPLSPPFSPSVPQEAEGCALCSTSSDSLTSSTHLSAPHGLTDSGLDRFVEFLTSRPAS